MKTDVIPAGGRRGTYVAAAITASLVVVGAVLFGMGARGADGPPQPDNTTASPAAASRAQGKNPRVTAPQTTALQPNALQAKAPASKPLDFGPVLPGSEPVALHIPAIDVHSRTIVDLGLADDGSIEVPGEPSAPGWFTPGPSPGQLGPAVLAGHVDSTRGPAVFYRLGSLHEGDRVRVSRADSSVATFVIDRVAVFPKADFPTHQVYGNVTNRAELRLITCGGGYDSATGYVSNVVAFAHLVGAK